jgi:2-dehydropantoate 2-reductase
VDQINGLVVDVLNAHGRNGPVNAAAVEFAHRIERGILEPATDLLPEFAAAAAGSR